MGSLKRVIEDTLSPTIDSPVVSDPGNRYFVDDTLITQYFVDDAKLVFYLTRDI